MDLDRMHWLDHGLHEIEAAETLEDALDEAHGLVTLAGLRLADVAERLMMYRGEEDTGHPVSEAVGEFRRAYAALVEVIADIRQRSASNP